MNRARLSVLFAMVGGPVLIAGAGLAAHPSESGADSEPKDTEVASPPVIRRVFPLKFANAKDLAPIMAQLFAMPARDQHTQRDASGALRAYGGADNGRRGGGQRLGGTGEVPAVSPVVVEPDSQTNSLIVHATEDILRNISDFLTKIDVANSGLVDTRIFRLQHAEATELADIITGLYGDTMLQNAHNRNRGQRGFGGGFGQPGGGGQQQQSQRALIKTKVLAVADPRTNSLLVTAARETMAEIAEILGRLDATDGKRQRIQLHSLEHADPDIVAKVLRGMLSDDSANNDALRKPAESRFRQDGDFPTPLERSRLVVPPSDRVRD